MNYLKRKGTLKSKFKANSIGGFYSKYIFLIMAATVFCSHDLYLKMDSYFLQPNQEATLSLYNGTFERSENIITRDRMLDACIISHGERKAIESNQWKDQDSTVTYLSFNTGKAGTYVAGVSTKARNIELSADKFNSYLEHDGVLDILAQRTANDLLDQDAVESYQKHVKAIYQVGDMRTDDWNTILDYPIEFVPQANPYEKYSGDSIDVQLLLDGKPLAGHLVFADYIKSAHHHSHGAHSHQHDGSAHSHDHDGQQHSSHTHEANDHSHTHGEKYRTNAQGIATVQLPEDGIYYLRTIHMIALNDSDTLTHASKWATLTFEVGHSHDTDAHAHDEHKHEGGIPTWGFILSSVVFVGLLFLYFQNKSQS